MFYTFKSYFNKRVSLGLYIIVVVEFENQFRSDSVGYLCLETLCYIVLFNEQLGISLEGRLK